MRKLWGGAFSGESQDLVDRFGQSIEDDLRFWREDVVGSIAHARMLGATGIIPAPESEELIRGLEQILEEGPERLPRDVEDIHTAVEVRLGEIVGEVAGKLHTARSRNDQVATDARLHLRARIDALLPRVKELQAILIAEARKHRAAPMPGYTHQQPAQPITLGYWLLAHFWAMQRQGWRLERLREVVNVSPLGAAALAGTGFPIDRRATAAELGFEAPIANALDATSDRSFVLDALHVACAAMLDLSRLSQDLVLFSTAEFGYLRLADDLTTGSSIMPQKRNPDMAELIRGRSARAIGTYTQLAATLKALPLGYNRDTQDDKPPLFETLDLLEDSLRLCGLMVSGARWNLPAMRKAALRGYSWVTDLADLLATSGMPFRKAHELTGQFVRLAEERGGASESVFREAVGSHLPPDLLDQAMQLPKGLACIRRRESEGGPGPKAMARQIRRAAGLLSRTGFGSIA